MKIGNSNSRARQQQRDGSKRRSTPQERDQDFRADVEDVKGRVRKYLDAGHVMLVSECKDAARRDGDFAAVQAIEEMSSEMRERNRENGGGSRRWVDEAVKEASKADRERRERVAERETARIAHETSQQVSGVGGPDAIGQCGESGVDNRFPTKGPRTRKRTAIGAPGKGYNPGPLRG